jgi:uncharacterized membrane protein YhaH (DUF805 family)
MSPRITRHLSLRGRLTRGDFWPYPVLFLFLCGALGFWQQNLPAGRLHDVSLLLIWPLLAVLLIAASKRCRDSNIAPWMAFAFTIFPLGLIALMILHPTKGPNGFGPDPRSRAGGV